MLFEDVLFSEHQSQLWELEVWKTSIKIWKPTDHIFSQVTLYVETTRFQSHPGYYYNYLNKCK